MATVAVDKLSPAEKEQLAVSYAAYILSGQGSEVTADSLNNVLKASGVTVNAGLVKAVAKSLKGRNVTEFFGSVGGSGSSHAESKPTEKHAEKPAEKPKK